MLKLAIIGNLEIAPGCVDRLRPLLMAHRAKCLANEPGTLAFEVLLPRDDQTKVLLYEVYADDASFQAHWNGPSTNRLREEAAGMILKVTGTWCALAECRTARPAEFGGAVAAVGGAPRSFLRDPRFAQAVREAFP
jgi:autoinducer 2-degrading protein